MQNSNSGQKLSAELKAIIDPVYNHDKARYQRLCRWVWTCQKAGWPDEAIGKAVELAGENVHKVNDWFGYLTKLLPKASGRAHEDEAQRYKREELDFFTKLLGPDWTKKRESDKKRA